VQFERWTEASAQARLLRPDCNREILDKRPQFSARYGAAGCLCRSRSNSASRPTHWEYIRFRIFDQDAVGT
jgi:hypothetical protein